MDTAIGVVGVVGGAALIVVGAELFAEHLAAASARLRISPFALALLLAGAEPEELATTVTASLRRVPAVSFGDVIGSNVAMCCVAVGVGAVVARGGLPFGPRVRRYALLGLPLGGLSAGAAWDGHVGRLGGAVLVVGYVMYVGTIWIRERQPPALGEAGELEHSTARSAATATAQNVVLTLAGVAGMVGGAVALVEGLRAVTDAEAAQTDLSLTLVGFATAFELVVLAWSAARRGISEAAVASVIGSFAYNATISLGVAALARPLRIADAASLHVPVVLMVVAFAVVLVLGVPRERISRSAGLALLSAYPAFVLYATLR